MPIGLAGSPEPSNSTYFRGDVPMAIELTDDGTMDTVLRCSECGEEFRFNYSSGPEEANAETETSDADAEAHYDEWVASCIEEMEAEHECSTDDKAE
jgi:hypothetical protein